MDNFNMISCTDHSDKSSKLGRLWAIWFKYSSNLHLDKDVKIVGISNPVSIGHNCLLGKSPPPPRVRNT